MIKAYSQRMSPPFYGQVQIAESDRARAVTIDGKSWEIHYLKGSNEGNRYANRPERSFVRTAVIDHSAVARIARQSSSVNEPIDERILELISFLAGASLPFAAADIYEYWLLDPEDGSPLALIFTCTEAGQMQAFPDRPEWTALPAAVMPVDATDAEKKRSDAPVNYRLERLVADRAGRNPRARWFTRRASESESFPPFLLREDWPEEDQHQLCQRYLRRQSTRLLMLHWLQHEERSRMELAAKAHAFEVERFYPLYPQVADERLMNAIRVEARLRGSTEAQFAPEKGRDGILYL